MKSVVCWLFGCFWTEEVITKVNYEWGFLDIEPYCSPEYGWVPKYEGHIKNHKNCTRCGKVNPNFTKEIEPLYRA